MFKRIPILIVIMVILSVASSVNAHIDDKDIGDVIYVSPTGCDCNDGLTSDKSKETINNAVKAVKNGGTIIISPGTHVDWSTIIINKNITLTGAGQNNTIIDGQSMRTCIAVKTGCTTIIQWLTIQNGQGDYGSVCYSDDGGGIYNKGTLTVKDCKITHNNARGCGGGIYNEGFLTVENCSITENTAKSRGGGVNDEYHGSYEGEGKLLIKNSKINNNKACSGGGLYIQDYSVLEQTEINSNSAEIGGGIYVYGDMRHALLVKYCTIKSNSATWYGGGIYNKQGSIKFYNSKVNRNWARLGGGVYNEEGKITYNTTDVSGNWLWNYGGKK